MGGALSLRGGTLLGSGNLIGFDVADETSSLWLKVSTVAAFSNSPLKFLASSMQFWRDRSNEVNSTNLLILSSRTTVSFFHLALTMAFLGIEWP